MAAHEATNSGNPRARNLTRQKSLGVMSEVERFLGRIGYAASRVHSFPVRKRSAQSRTARDRPCRFQKHYKYFAGI